MAGVIVVAILLAIVVVGGLISYRQTLGRGPYGGSMHGAVSVGSLLGVFLGLTAGLATLLIVLLVRALR
ncbi:MAG TPA: hypothetical protein VKV26_10310 [Dehalococcoidia bacterium]|nr:hypothetical protein [Dehalococcoidia bacterium]